MFSLLPFCLVASYFCAAKALTRSINHDDICGEFNGRRLYLEQGKHGTLLARNQSKGKSSVGSNYDGNFTIHTECSLEIVTCPSCVITIQFTFLNLSRNCGKKALLDSCWCDYVWIFEPSYENVSGEQFCGHFVETSKATLSYKSQTRSTTVKFIHSSSYDHAFTLKYFTERNRYLIDGVTKQTSGTQQYFTSPFFPKHYPRDISVEYVLNCKAVKTCKIQLTFTDFQISRLSLIEFFDSNGQRMFATTGSLFRPPILVSSGPTLVVRFYANGGTNLGYKAVYSFVSEKQLNSTRKINTDCGGYVDNLGGGITMMNMVEEGVVSYDCLWIIRPPQSYLHLRKHLFVKVTQFEYFAGSAELTIREGLTTNEPTVEHLKYPLTKFSLSKFKEHIVPINEGFYIGLRGSFRSESKLEIVYAAFSYKDCSTVSNFLCTNQRCISTLLRCDGFDHCGDSSDEVFNCDKETTGPRGTHTPNFYFPKADRYIDLKTATIIFIISSLALISLIISLIVLLYRINVRGNNHRDLQNHLQAINDLLGESSSRYEEVDIILTDDPPSYEAPPDYSNIVQPAFEGNGHRKKTLKRSIRRRSTRRSCSHCHNNPLLDEGSIEIIYQDSANTSTAGNAINLLMASDNRSCQAPIAVPDSPPPVYELVDKRLPKDNKIAVYMPVNMITFEGAKNIIDYLNIDLPFNHNRKGNSVFTQRLLKDERDLRATSRFVNCERKLTAPSRNRHLSDSELLSISNGV